ncbi:hypothetical protein [uncultured Catenibacterium sp.]|uniref:hypothetical protein n=1 Tax=uncultured Catenibacterium sp. TaxID=286142 RepID=UPI0025F2FEDF|nr:hypothetical protein [uncultured Catenibacterium sp.]
MKHLKIFLIVLCIVLIVSTPIVLFRYNDSQLINHEKIETIKTKKVKSTLTTQEKIKMIYDATSDDSHIVTIYKEWKKDTEQYETLKMNVGIELKKLQKLNIIPTFTQYELIPQNIETLIDGTNTTKSMSVVRLNITSQDTQMDCWVDYDTGIILQGSINTKIDISLKQAFIQNYLKVSQTTEKYYSLFYAKNRTFVRISNYRNDAIMMTN